jgi:acyl-CoA dehydrogenase
VIDSEPQTSGAFLQGIEALAVDVAGPAAGDVDARARFPQESVDALKSARALSALVPTQFGGGGLSIGDMARACQILGGQCASTGMIFAMHQIQAACIVRHGAESAWFVDYLGTLVDEQRLLASATSEVGTGGDMGQSVACVVPGADDMSNTFEKEAPTVSYGSFADDLLTTVRRGPQAEGGDQVLVLTNKQQSQLDQRGTWDPFGMRGTCSPGFVISATFPTEQIFTTPFSSISVETMVPVSHILWSHVWLGIAENAFERARSFVRASRRGATEATPAALRLSQLLTELSLLRAEVASALADFVAADATPGRQRLSTLHSVLRFNNLKIAASEQAPRICADAMTICGIVGYKNDTPFSIGRHLRDAMSGPLMVANDRIRQTNASLLLIAKDA